MVVYLEKRDVYHYMYVINLGTLSWFLSYNKNRSMIIYHTYSNSNAGNCAPPDFTGSFEGAGRDSPTTKRMNDDLQPLSSRGNDANHQMIYRIYIVFYIQIFQCLSSLYILYSST